MSIALTLSRKDLVALDGTPARANGLALFDVIKAEYDDARAKAGKAPRRGLTVTWTRVHQVWIAVEYPGFSAWLRANGLAPNVSLRGANLYGAARTSAARTSAGVRVSASLASVLVFSQRRPARRVAFLIFVVPMR